MKRSSQKKALIFFLKLIFFRRKLGKPEKQKLLVFLEKSFPHISGWITADEAVK